LRMPYPSIRLSVKLTSQHAASYPISSLNKGRTKDKQYHHPSYSPTIPLIPHGVAVSLTAPAVFNFTAPSDPQRHRDAISVFMGKERSSELDRVRDEDLGTVLREEIQKFLDLLGVPRGLAQVGYTSNDVQKVSQDVLYSVASADSCSLSKGCCLRNECLTSPRFWPRTTSSRRRSS
jgi:alcohol dehydrogenase class IV